MFQNIQLLKKFILLMISNREKGQWHYLTVKKLSSLLRGITSYCLNYFH